MTNNSLWKKTGSVMMIIGTEVGAGILALPIITAKMGCLVSVMIMFMSWFIMTYTAILIADISVSMPRGFSFYSMVKKVFNSPLATIINWIVFVLLIYSISTAYISGASSAFSSIYTNISQEIWAFIFVFIFSIVVTIGTKVVDLINKILLCSKLTLLMIVCILMLPNVKVNNILNTPVDFIETFIIAMPAIITCFTSHIIIPMLSDYLNQNKQDLYNSILIGTIVPLFLYILWLIITLGVLPLRGDISFFSCVFNESGIRESNLGDILRAINKGVINPLANLSINIFTCISVMTSYMGVSLSLYHFNIDSYNLKKLNKVKKTITSIVLTFLIPLLLNIIYPNLFIKALNYVGIFISILLIITPILMVYHLGKRGYKFNYRISGIRSYWFISLLTGITIVLVGTFFS